MGYKKVSQVLPRELVEEIQKYIEGEYLYIPRKEGMKKKWGSNTSIRLELSKRNKKICNDRNNGYSIEALAEKYYLSIKSIQRVVRQEKK